MKTKLRNIKTVVVALAAMCLPIRTALAQPYDGPLTADPEYKHASAEAFEKWQDLKFGLRIHWGVYTLWGIEASWPLLQMTDEKRTQYQELYKQFNPQQFNPDQWMQWFKRWGFTYFAFTSRHCDSFSMWDTKTRVHRRVNYAAPGGPRPEDCDVAYSIMESPYQKDLIKELTDAAHKSGIAVNLYFSHWDWFDYDFRGCELFPYVAPGDKITSAKTDSTGYARMVKRHRDSIRELLSDYGRIDMLCLDTRWPEFCWPDMKETVKMARQLQPDCLFRNRGIGAYGDYHTPENWIPDSPKSRESAMSWMVIYNLGGLYAYDPNGKTYKPGSWIVTNLIDICAKGGNFMVNASPDANGHWHPEAVKRLEYAGDWLRVNGEAIYKTRPWTHWKEGEDIRFTRAKDNQHVYAISLKWPGQKLALKSVKPREGSQIRMLGLAEPLPWSLGDNGLVIELPPKLQDEANRPCQQAYAFKIEGTPREHAGTPGS